MNSPRRRQQLVYFEDQVDKGGADGVFVGLQEELLSGESSQDHSQLLRQRRGERRCRGWWFHVVSLFVGAFIATLYHRGSIGVGSLVPRNSKNTTSTAENDNNNNNNNSPTPSFVSNRTSSNVFDRQTIPPHAIPERVTDEFPHFHTPILGVGYPRSGSFNMHKFFQCNGATSQHYCCCGSNATHWPCPGGRGLGRCLFLNLQKDRPILEGCGDSDVFAEMDMEDTKSRYFLPQHFNLDDFTKQHPQATFLLTTRPPENWADSVANWFDMKKRFLKAFQISRHYPGGAQQALIDIYTNHTQEIRQHVRENPSHTLIEVDVDSDNIAEQMANIFGGAASCYPSEPPN